MSTRLRSRPQLLQHEQEDAHLTALNEAALQQAISLSLRPPESDSSESSGVDTDSEAQEEEKENAVFGTEPFDEQRCVDDMDEKQQAAFNRATVADSAAGWQERCPDTGRHQFSLQPEPRLPTARHSHHTRIGRKSNRWWTHLAWFMIDMAANNAYVLYRLCAQRKLSAAQFREELMEALVGSFTQRKKRGRSEKVHYREDEPLLPMHLSEQQPCVVCAKKRKLTDGKHKPRMRDGCETCGCAVHFTCWKQHLDVESKVDE